MKNTQNLSILMILFILLSNTLPAKEISKPFDVRLTYSRQSTGKFYDYSGKSFLKMDDDKYSPQVDTISYKTDTTDLVLDTVGWNSRDYTFNYSRHSIKLDFIYKPNKYIQLQASMPLSFYSLAEKWGMLVIQNGSEEVTYDAQPKANYNLTRIDYFGLDCEGYALNDKFILGMRGSLHIPSGGETSVQNSADYPFLSDGYLDIRTGPIIGFRHKNMRFNTEILYNYRGEEPVDNIMINGTLAWSAVENTEMRVMLFYSKSLEPYKEEYKFMTTRESLWEEYFDLAFEVKMKFTDNIYAYGGFRNRWYDKNTWNIGMFWFTGSYIF